MPLAVGWLPSTNALPAGVLRLAAFLGGAVASHYRLGNPLATHVLVPVYVAALLWGGLVPRSLEALALLLGRA